MMRPAGSTWRDAGRTRLLVSVRDAAEAALAAAAGADLVDAKDPARGALGALMPHVARAIAQAARAECAGVGTSAVAGEPQDSEALAAALAAMAEAETDLLKVALPPAGLAQSAPLRQALAATAQPVIVVLFAEDGPDPALVPQLAALGFAGAMIDTRLKNGTRLPDLLPAATLSAFVEACRRQGLMSGLAGSLSLADIPGLARHRPDYLGFRGGLCAGADRRGALDPGRIREAASLLAGEPARDAA